jgi:hypothetical protein
MGHSTRVPRLASLITLAGVVCVWLVGASPMAAQVGGAALPPAVEQYLSALVRPTTGERRRLLAGQPMTRLLDGAVSLQVTVLGAIWINAPVRRYVEAVQDIAVFERGRSFRVTRRLSSPPRIEDFSDVRLSAADVADLRVCRVGSCQLKLDEAAIGAFQRGVDWASPNHHAQAEALMRRFMLDRATAYLEGGNKQLPVYRDKVSPLSMDAEFRALVDDLPEAVFATPGVRGYLLGFPSVALADSSSFLYWQETTFGLKPTLRLSHLTVHEGPRDVVVVSKMLYAHHYFRSGLETRVLMPDAARGGFWLVTVNSSRTDGLTGFTGLFVRPRVRGDARDGTATMLINTKRKIEGHPDAAF